MGDILYVVYIVNVVNIQVTILSLDRYFVLQVFFDEIFQNMRLLTDFYRSNQWLFCNLFDVLFYIPQLPRYVNKETLDQIQS